MIFTIEFEDSDTVGGYWSVYANGEYLFSRATKSLAEASARAYASGLIARSAV